MNYKTCREWVFENHKLYKRKKSSTGSKSTKTCDKNCLKSMSLFLSFSLPSTCFIKMPVKYFFRNQKLWTVKDAQTIYAQSVY